LLSFINGRLIRRDAHLVRTSTLARLIVNKARRSILTSPSRQCEYRARVTRHSIAQLR
jgi:hypothetical protein